RRCHSHTPYAISVAAKSEVQWKRENNLAKVPHATSAAMARSAMTGSAKNTSFKSLENGKRGRPVDKKPLKSNPQTPYSAAQTSSPVADPSRPPSRVGGPAVAAES